jgi:photosystem II stability/assembly factor-like uncharacterized protein
LSFAAIHFENPMTGMLVGERVFEDDKSAVIVTSDGGATWQSDLGTVSGRLLGGRFFDAEKGWVVGEQGAVMATSDGGATWDVQTSKALADLFDVHFVSDQIGWAVGQNSTVVKTTNGGNTWSVLVGGQPSGEVGEGAVMYMGVHFLDETTGFAAGSGVTGVIDRTTDGGKTWETVFEAEENLRGISFMDSTTGWATGKYGLLLATTDAGETWEQKEVGTEEDIYSVSPGDEGHIWISGDYGTIAYSGDLGDTWRLVSVSVEFFGTMKELRGPIMAVSAIGNEAWAITDVGRVLYFRLD